MLGINMSCRVFNAVTATGALLFDCITLFFLLDSFIEGDKKFKLLICGTFFTIGELFIWLTYHSEKSVSENNFKFLPSPLKCKAFRITIYALIMILDTLAFWQGFMDNNIDVPLFDWKGFKESRFGGYKEGNKLAWTLGFGTAVGAMILDFLATDGTLQYKPDDFKLPAYVMNVLTK